MKKRDNSIKDTHRFFVLVDSPLPGQGFRGSGRSNTIDDLFSFLETDKRSLLHQNKLKSVASKNGTTGREGKTQKLDQTLGGTAPLSQTLPFLARKQVL